MAIAYYVNPRIRRQFHEAAARRSAPPVDPAAWGSRHLSAVARVWADAVADVPHYAALVARGDAPPAIRDWQDFQAVPVLTRQAIQDTPAAFVRRSGPPDAYANTAGSTGTPLRFGAWRSERALMRVVKLAAWQSFGYTPSSRLFLMWGHAHLLGTGWRGRVNHARRLAADWALGYRRVNAYRLTPATSLAFGRALIRARPVGVIGYAAALDLFARQTPSLREELRALGLGFVLATSEPLPRPDTQALLEDHFGCPLVQEYGGVDFGQVAFKAGTAPFDVYGDLDYVECVDAPAAEPGAHPVLLTSLYPRYLPLVRYRNEDTIVAPERLAHGHVARFASVGGRLNDTFALAEGDAIYSLSIFHSVHQEPSVHNLQMVLRDTGIEMCLVAPGADRPALEARIRGRLSQVHPALGAVTFRYADDVETSRAGKRRWIVDRRTTIPCAVSPAS